LRGADLRTIPGARKREGRARRGRRDPLAPVRKRLGTLRRLPDPGGSRSRGRHHPIRAPRDPHHRDLDSEHDDGAGPLVSRRSRLNRGPASVNLIRDIRESPGPKDRATPRSERLPGAGETRSIRGRLKAAQRTLDPPVVVRVHPPESTQDGTPKNGARCPRLCCRLLHISRINPGHLRPSSLSTSPPPADAGHVEVRDACEIAPHHDGLRSLTTPGGAPHPPPSRRALPSAGPQPPPESRR